MGPKCWNDMENKPNGCHVLIPCTTYMFSAFTYIIVVCCQTHFNLLFSIILKCVTYSLLCATCFVLSLIDLLIVNENPICSISAPLNSPGKHGKWT